MRRDNKTYGLGGLLCRYPEYIFRINIITKNSPQKTLGFMASGDGAKALLLRYATDIKANSFSG